MSTLQLFKDAKPKTYKTVENAEKAVEKISKKSGLSLTWILSIDIKTGRYFPVIRLDPEQFSLGVALVHEGFCVVG